MIPIAKPQLGDAEAEAAARAIRSGWVTQGPEVAAFEREFAAYVGASHACATSSCTTALHLALMGVGVGAGDEVITVSHSFIATSNAVVYCGAEPVFVDIEAASFNIDPKRIAAAITPRTKAILVVHQIGLPADMAAIMPIAREHGLKVVEDAACAIGSELLWDGAWRRIGAPVGDVVCFSFHPRKLVTTGDGGLLTTADASLDARFRLWRQHGMTVPDSVRHGSPTVVFEDYAEIGWNYRMTDIQAAMGRVQLGRLPALLDERRQQVEGYRERLARLPVALPVEPNWARHNWQSFSIRLPDGVEQRGVMQAMLDRGVATRRGIMCAHREPAYAGRPPRFPLPHSESAQDRCILLPLFAGLTAAQQDAVVEALAAALG